jgi:flagellin-like protein
MFQLLKKYRKGVSPVIAIVLLIALTVAAAAVIWTLTSGILDDATGDSLNVKSSSGSINGTGNVLTVTYTLSASSAMTLTAAEIISNPNTAASGTVTNDIGTGVTILDGDNSVTIVFTSTAAGDFTTGTYKINLSWIVEGGSTTITESSVQAS